MGMKLVELLDQGARVACRFHSNCPQTSRKYYHPPAPNHPDDHHHNQLNNNNSNTCALSGGGDGAAMRFKKADNSNEFILFSV